MALADITKDAVLAAMAEFDRLGQDAFLTEYKFGRAMAYFLEYEGKLYDSKAIVGYAHGEIPGQRRWTASDFTGGESSVAHHLRDRLGFRVVNQRRGEKVLGEIDGIDVGATFPDRTALRLSGLHRAGQAGIVGTAATGAESVVVSGGYEDDLDLGDVIIYTGHGGQQSGKQVADQSPDASGNAALITSCTTGEPVRVIRGRNPESPHAPASGYRYDGLFRVERFWMEEGKSGFLVCRYKLISLDAYHRLLDIESVGVPPRTPEGNAEPARTTSTVQRLIRSSLVSEHVKKLYDHTCQICATRLAIGARGYSEGAHIRPLGQPHDGPDVVANLLCLCANCHVLFDYGAITVADDMTIIGGDHSGQPLTVHSLHNIASEHMSYHRGLYKPLAEDR